VINPPITACASGSMPKIIAAVVMMIGRSRTRAIRRSFVCFSVRQPARAQKHELDGSPEVQDVTVRIHDLEPAQVIRVDAEWLPKRYATGCELPG
jgi:hypothetical protein